MLAWRKRRETPPLCSTTQRGHKTREITANDNFLQFFSSSVLQFFFQKGAFIVWCISHFPCVISTRETFLPKPRISLSLSHSGWGDDFYTRARARDIYIDTCIDSIRCVRLILTNLLLSSPSSSSPAVLFFLGSAVSPLSLFRPNRTNERTRKREKKEFSL